MMRAPLRPLIYFTPFPHAELLINGQSCLRSMEYYSSKKLVCLTGDATGPGRIIVTTLSGGSGTCTVTFFGRERELTPLLGMTEGGIQSMLTPSMS